MDQYAVKGMSCAACVARVEKAVRKVEGVEDVTVSLLTNSMTVSGTAPTEAVVKAVKAAGYGAKPVKQRAFEKPDEDGQSEFRSLRKRFLISLAVLLVLMYVSMGHMMLGWPLPPFLSSHLWVGITEAVLSLAVLIINRKFFISGTKGVLHLSPNMDTLVALGSGVSYVYSLVLLVMNAVNGSAEMADYYFESAAMILVLITLGKMLEAYSKGKTTGAIDALKKLAPDTAVVLRNGKETVIASSELKTGDLFVVRPGESFPCDGVVKDGSSSVNEASLTGESIPVDKEPGSTVSAGTVNQTGYLICEATGTGEETMLARIIRLVMDSSASKAPAQRLADRISGIFVPVVIGIALVTFAVWMIIGVPFATALTHAISVLVVSCPCALGLATPVAIMVGSGVGARSGLLFKTAASLEECGKVQKIVMDKTGTITTGKPEVTDVILAETVTEAELLQKACALEARSEHPLAKAVLEYAVKQAEDSETAGDDTLESFEALPGKGLSGVLSSSNRTLYGGKEEWIRTITPIPETIAKQTDVLRNEGKTVLFFAEDDRFLGAMSVFDTLKDDAVKAIAAMKEMRLTPVLLSGDSVVTAQTIGKAAGVTEVIGEVLPDEKEEKIRNLMADGSKVLMVGDGINDAPALTRADVGMAIGAGTDIAIDAADVVLINSHVYDVVKAVRLSKAVYRNIKQNLFWAFFYNLLMIPLAAGVFTGITGWTMSPMIGAAAMSLSSFTVVMNALRLNLVKLEKKS